MKILMIGLIVGLLAIASVVVVNALQDDEVVSVQEPSCGSCSGGCSAGNSCGNPSCGFEKTGSCGCRG